MNKPLPPELVPQMQEPSRERTLAICRATLADLASCDDSFLLLHIHPDGAISTQGLTASVQDNLGIVGAALSGLRAVADFHGQQHLANMAATMLAMLGMDMRDTGGIQHRPAPPP
jgi:hypothetical protein